MTGFIQKGNDCTAGRQRLANKLANGQVAKINKRADWIVEYMPSDKDPFPILASAG